MYLTSRGETWIQIHFRVSAASENPKIRNKITSVSILVQNISKQAADLRSIDEEKN